MTHLQRFFLINSRRDLVSKSETYENINKLNSLVNINLNFSELKSKSFVILCLSFFYLLANKKGKYKAFSSKVGKNINKNLVCSLRLEKNEIFLFLEKILLVNFNNKSRISNLFFKKSFSSNKTLSFTIKDIYSFTEFEEELFKYRYLRNLRVYFSFLNKKKKKNSFLLQSLGF